VAGGVALGSAVGAPHEAHLAKDVPGEGHVAQRLHQLASDGYQLRDWKAVVSDSALRSLGASPGLDLPLPLAFRHPPGVRLHRRNRAGLRPRNLRPRQHLPLRPRPTLRALLALCVGNRYQRLRHHLRQARRGYLRGRYQRAWAEPGAARRVGVRDEQRGLGGVRGNAAAVGGPVRGDRGWRIPGVERGERGARVRRGVVDGSGNGYGVAHADGVG